MLLSLIAAVSENNVIGAGNSLVWKLRDDTAFFMRTTLGHTVIMGRKTFDSMGKPLRDRRNLIISQNSHLVIPGAEVFTSLAAAIEASNASGNVEDLKNSDIFVIGGEAIYREALPLANRVYMTRIHSHVEGDAFFPEVDWKDWEVVSSREAEADSRNEFAATYVVFQRRKT